LKNEGRGDAVETGRPKWLGGFIRETARGKRVYVIEKRIKGELFKVSTRCHTEKAALAELARFEVDPMLYVPGGAVGLRMTSELIIEYRNWQLTERGNSHEWAHTSGNMLADWQAALGEIDLRRLTSARVKETLQRWDTSRPARVTCLKGFYTWLRKEKGLLKHHEDPMPDVRIPERKSSKETGARDVPFEVVCAVFRALRPDVRDILQMMAGTGMHLAEAARFAEKGEIRPDPSKQALATLTVWHKRKEDFAYPVTSQDALDAATRIREQGWMLNRHRLWELMVAANKAAGVPDEQRLNFGDMRHCVATWAIELGEDIRNVARAYNHESEAMLRKHYVRHAVPRAIIKTRPLA
jgi:integrase